MFLKPDFEKMLQNRSDEFLGKCSSKFIMIEKILAKLLGKNENVVIYSKVP
jgi:hypothetical protein